MDALDNEIAERRQERVKLQEKLRDLDVVIAALEKAASLRPASTSARQLDLYRQGILSNLKGDTVPQPTLLGSKGGRKAGDINKQWRDILWMLYLRGERLGYREIISAVSQSGHEVSENSVRDRVRNLVRTGLMQGDARQGFVVTENAVKRFGFTKETAPAIQAGAAEEAATSSESPTQRPQDAQPKEGDDGLANQPVLTG